MNLKILNGVYVDKPTDVDYHNFKLFCKSALKFLKAQVETPSVSDNEDEKKICNCTFPDTDTAGYWCYRCLAPVRKNY